MNSSYCWNYSREKINAIETHPKLIILNLAVKEIGSHQQLQGNLRGNGEFRNFSAAVGVAHLVGEVHANLLQDVGPRMQKTFRIISLKSVYKPTYGISRKWTSLVSFSAN